ncbi:hypothetical protein GmHk_01G002019 [Glycine max]|nr:hypothetical protein GmHk_01G002019 [Glycine max]
MGRHSTRFQLLRFHQLDPNKPTNKATLLILFGPSSASRAMQKTNREKGIVIEELDTDDEGADNGPETGEKDFDKKTKKLTQQLARQHIGSLEESMTRRLDSDGNVDTTQTLHNLNEDELVGFEEAWKGNNMAQFPGFNVHRKEEHNNVADSSSGKHNRNPVWPLQYLEPAGRSRGFPSNYEAGTNSGGRTKKVVRINIDMLKALVRIIVFLMMVCVQDGLSDDGFFGGKITDDDLGQHVLAVGEHQEWSFGTRVFGNTLFWCTMDAGNVHASFEIYNAKTEVATCNAQCNRILNNDGGYFFNEYSGYWEKRLSWHARNIFLKYIHYWFEMLDTYKLIQKNSIVVSSRSTYKLTNNLRFFLNYPKFNEFDNLKMTLFCSAFFSPSIQFSSYSSDQIKKMQKGREVRDNNIFEPRRFEDFGDFGFHRSRMPSLFGGRDPFDDPFFTDPFDSLFGPSSASRAMQKTNREKGIVIEEIDSDDEGADNGPETGEKDFDKKKSKSTMEPSIEYPDDDVNERKNSDVTYKNDHCMAEPKARKFSFQTSRVTYGGIDGAYYTSTRIRRMGANGEVMEENKEADTTTGQASHRITRGIHDKGHSVLRKLDSDGKVDTTQTLHNLNEDELAGFEEAWKGNNMAQLPGFDVHRKEEHSNVADSSSGKHNRKQVWPLQYLEPAGRSRGFPSNYEAGTDSGGRTKKVLFSSVKYAMQSKC